VIVRRLPGGLARRGLGTAFDFLERLPRRHLDRAPGRRVEAQHLTNPRPCCGLGGGTRHANLRGIGSGSRHTLVPHPGDGGADRSTNPARSEASGHERIYYGCMYRHQRGVHACANDLTVTMDDANAAFLDTLRYGS
jgi:hypothetical protein